MVGVRLNQPLEHGKEVKLTMMSFVLHWQSRGKGSKRGQVGLDLGKGQQA